MIYTCKNCGMISSVHHANCPSCGKPMGKLASPEEYVPHQNDGTIVPENPAVSQTTDDVEVEPSDSFVEKVRRLALFPAVVVAANVVLSIIGIINKMLFHADWLPWCSFSSLLSCIIPDFYGYFRFLSALDIWGQFFAHFPFRATWFLLFDILWLLYPISLVVFLIRFIILKKKAGMEKDITPEAAAQQKKITKIVWQTWGSIAASACIFFCCLFIKAQ